MQTHNSRGAGEAPKVKVGDLASSPEFIEEQAKAFAECRECFEKALLEAAWPNLTEDQRRSATKAIEMLGQGNDAESQRKPITGPLGWHYPVLNRILRRNEK